MLDFSFTPAQEEFRAQLRELALRELLPQYQLADREERYPDELIRRVIRFCADFWKGREEHWDLVAVGITAEELARGDFNCVLPSLGEPYRSQFLGHLSEAQKECWLEELMSGEKIIGLAITEPAAGSDMGRLEARAERRGQRWILNGVKNSVSYLNADVFYVFMRTDPEAPGWKGISSFLIPRDTPGLSFEPVPDLGCRAIPRGLLRMKDVDLGDDALVGELGSAFIRISRFFDVNRAVIGLKCAGAALQTLDETVSYASERIAFGGPLMGHQAVSFQLRTRRGRDVSRDGALAVLPRALDAGAGDSVPARGCDGEVVGAQGLRRGHPPVPPVPRSQGLQPRAPHPAATARRDRLADRRRLGRSDEADHRPGLGSRPQHSKESLNLKRLGLSYWYPSGTAPKL
jgi:cyclohexanecarboxyl-CoA dehydrogenase